MADEKLCLQWNDFQNNISSAFRDLRDDERFTDVTLVCDDGPQIDAHKLVLVSCSPFFKNLLRRSKHTHPIIYMRGVQSKELAAIRDFLYQGEANVHQEDLNSFLALADELQLKGLQANDQQTKENISETFEPKNIAKNPNISTERLRFAEGKKFKFPNKTISNQPMESTTINERALSLNTDSSFTNEKELAEKVKSMMLVSENRVTNKKERARICKVCGKEGQFQNMTSHIEANHITGIVLPCNICGITTASRNGLAQHKLKFHKQ